MLNSTNKALVFISVHKRIKERKSSNFCTHKQRTRQLQSKEPVNMTQIKHFLLSQDCHNACKWSISEKKNGYKFVVDSSNESLPFDWYNVYFELDFQITETTDNTNYAAENAVAVVNGAFPLINQLKVDFNGANVLDTPGINHAFNVKNLTEFSKDYSERGGPCLFTMWIQLSMLILLTIQ